MSKILVMTAATGKKSGGAFAECIGKNLSDVNRLFPDGIRAIIRPPADTAKLEAAIPNVTKCIGALEDISFLETAFRDADTVVHIAGIHWSREVVQAAAACHVRRLILVHTTGIYSKYKKAGEEYRQIDDFAYRTCRENGILLTILRPTMIYGNATDQNVIVFVKMVDKIPLMPVVNGARYALQPVHYQDLADAYYAVLTHESETSNRDYILSGKEPILLRDMLQIIGQKLDKKVRFISCPFPVAYIGAWILHVLSLRKLDFREKVQRLCEPRAYSHAEATRAFGYTPRSFSEGVIGEIEEYRSMKNR